MLCNCENKNKEIAVILDRKGHTGVLSDPGKVIIYQRNSQNCMWEIIRETEFSMDYDTLAEIRKNIASLIEFLKECRIFVAKSASGAIFFELQKAGFSVWEIQGTPAEFLDSVAEDEDNIEKSQKTQSFEIPAPLEISPNNFTISIKEVQGKLPGVSSKMILKQFISDSNFESLEITCDHIPPWIEFDADRKGLNMETEKKSSNEYLIKLSKNQI